MAETEYEARLLLLGRRLRALRRSRGLSMRMADEVRLRFGVRLDPSHLSRVERGRTGLPLRTLFALAAYFEVDPARLIEPEEKGEQVDRTGELLGRLEGLLADAMKLVRGEGRGALRPRP